MKLARSAFCAKCGVRMGAGEVFVFVANKDKKKAPGHVACASDEDGDVVDDGEAPATPKPEASAIQANDAAAALAALVEPYIQRRTVSPEALAAAVKAAVDAATMPQTIVVQNADRAEVKIDGAHAAFKRVLAVVTCRDHNGWPLIPLLVGPPGSGKSTLAKQVSLALSLRFGFDSLTPADFPGKLFGTLLAGGEFKRPLFSEAYEHGGVHCLDEVCNTSAQLQAALNTALANGHGSFAWGLVHRHKDCHIIGCDNTDGSGPTAMFPERRRMDPAFRDRFVVIEVGYDETLEQRIAASLAGDKGLAWARWIQALRAVAVERCPQFVVTPRASINGAAMLAAGMPSEVAAPLVVWKGLGLDQQKTLLGAAKMPSL